VHGELKLIAPGDLRPHEAVDPDRVASLVEELREAGTFYPPVLVDRATRVILDGHHRWKAASELGLRLLPCYCVDYLGDDTIRIFARRPEVDVSKPLVLAMARRGATFPVKTTRHAYDLPEEIAPIALEALRGE